MSAAISQFQGAGLSWGSVEAQIETRETPWYDTLTAEQMKVLAYSEAHDDEAMFRDICLSSFRVRFSTTSSEGNHMAFCQMPAQLVWVRPGGGKMPRLQIGREALLLQGYPIARIPVTMAATTERVICRR